MLSIAVCEDEQYMIDDLSEKVKFCLENRHISYEFCSFINGELLLESHKKFDLIFLDIQMEGTCGMDVAKILRGRQYDGLIIFTTALKDMVFKSFEVEAFDFLVKPLETGAFSRTLDRAIERININKEKSKSNDQNLIVHKNNEKIIIPYQDIIYCEAINRKVYVHTKMKVIDYYNKLEELEKTLGKEFYRCHRSYLINLKYVRGSRNGTAQMDNEDKVPISRLREQEFAQVILEYMKGKRY